MAPTKAVKATKKTVKKAGKRTTKKAPRKRIVMSASHKKALSVGRDEARLVRDYIDALDLAKPKRGRKISKADLEKRLSAIKTEIVQAKRSDRLFLVQRRIDTERAIRANGTNGVVDLKPLERSFVRVGKKFAERKGISRSAFREVGVPARILTEAGIR